MAMIEAPHANDRPGLFRDTCPELLGSLGFWEWEPTRRAALCTEALLRALGLPDDEPHVSYRRFLGLVHPHDRADVRAKLREARHRRTGWRIQCRIVRPDGCERIVYAEAVMSGGGAPASERIVGIAQDLTERLRSEDKIRQLAYFDPLTGLPNRALLLEYLNYTLARAKRLHQCVALLFIDLDDFKPVNDTHGHEAGDVLLREVARRLVGCIRMKRRSLNPEPGSNTAVVDFGDIAARLAGDEFVIILPDVGDAGNGAAVARRILANLSRPFDINGNAVSISASLGMSLFPGNGHDVAALLRHADAAMYRAKAERPERGAAGRPPRQPGGESASPQPAVDPARGQGVKDPSALAGSGSRTPNPPGPAPARPSSVEPSHWDITIL